MLDTWQTITSFLTPATLFLLLNLVIGIILLSSRRHHGNQEIDPSGTSFADAYHFPLLRTNSPVLNRLRSLTLYRFRSGDLPTDAISSPRTPTANLNPIPAEAEPNSNIRNGIDDGEVINAPVPAPAPSPPPLARTSSILDRIKSINLYRFRSGEIQTEEVKTETTVTATVSTEHHYGRSHSEARPVEKKKKKMTKIASVGGEGDGIDVMEVRQRTSFRARDVVVEEGVDARADDFINKFKEQLKIQRLNSIMNYKEMLDRGR